MIGTYTSSKDFSPPLAAINQLMQGDRSWKRHGVVLGLGGGLIAPIVGSAFTVISWFADPAWHSVHIRTIGTVFFVLAIPLLILGAHCLDLLDAPKAKHETHSHGQNRDAVAAGQRRDSLTRKDKQNPANSNQVQH